MEYFSTNGIFFSCFLEQKALRKLVSFLLRCSSVGTIKVSCLVSINFNIEAFEKLVTNKSNSTTASTGKHCIVKSFKSCTRYLFLCSSGPQHYSARICT